VERSTDAIMVGRGSREYKKYMLWHNPTNES
jgi:hypothetical protein